MSQVSSAVVVGSSKALWATVGVLGVAVAGLGGALIYTQTRSVTPAEAPVAQVAAPTPETAPAVVQAEPTPAPVQATPEAKPKAKPKAKVAVKSEPVPVAAMPQPEPVPMVVKPICVVCATVASVTPVEREGEGRGGGAVAGGVLGALVGNQFGQGSGKDLATIVGAVGGGIAGNQIEKKMNKVTTYRVELHMDDGNRRVMELGNPVGVGSRVRVDGSTLIALPAGQ